MAHFNKMIVNMLSTEAVKGGYLRGKLYTVKTSPAHAAYTKQMNGVTQRNDMSNFVLVALSYACALPLRAVSDK